MNIASPSLLPAEFADTDLCVLCGMCTPHCPTYSVFKIEAESPRGRISIIQALARQQLEADDKTLAHLNHCLGCRACETICPSKVPFMALMDKARQLTAPQHKRAAVIERLLTATQQPGGLRQQQGKLSIIHKLGLHHIAKRVSHKPSISASASLLAHGNFQKFNDYYPANNKQAASVLLFTGCMGTGFNSDTLQSSIKLLNYFGFNVHIPTNQHCCGALHLHNGHIDTAMELAEKNKAVFQQYDVDALLYIDSGCGTELGHQSQTTPVLNIGQFILNQIKPGSEHFLACEQSVWLHESCSLRNSLKHSGLIQKLLSLIPGLTSQTLNHPETCCGAGGSNFIEYPELADQLLEQKLKAFLPSQTGLLISDNIGCSLHFKTGLQHRQLNLQVIHPVTLLAMQLK